jgi:hypothetical protein
MNIFENLKNFDKVGLIIAFIGSWILMVPIINSTTNWDIILLQTSIGLLTFVAIFYSFILKKDFLQKRDELITNRWNENITDFQNLLNKIKHGLKKKSKDMKKLISDSEELNNVLNSVAKFEDETNIEKSLLNSSIFFLTSIFLFLFDMIIDFQIPWQGITYTARFFAFTMMWYALYHTLELVRKWFVVTRYDK